MHISRFGARCALVGVMLAALGPAVHAGAQEAPVAQLPAGDDPTPYSEIQLVSSVASIQPGASFTLAVHITVDPGWHTYWTNGGDAGDELLVDWTLPAGFTAGPFQWPTPKLLPAPPLMSYGYEGQLFVLVDITAPTEVRPGSTVEIRGAADFQVCADICLIALDEIALTLPVRAGPAEPDPNWAGTIQDVAARLPEPAEGWTVRAWTSGAEGESAAYLLEISPRAGTELPTPASLSAPHLFADSGYVIEHAAPQRVARVGDALRIEIPRNYFEAEFAERLGGVLVADVSTESPAAWIIEATVGEVPADLAGEDPDPLRAPNVQATGGVPEGMAPLGRPPEAAPTETASAMGVFAALVFAFLGGAILNLMPCVFPVLSVKALGLVDKGGEAPARVRAHGFAFGAGVLVSLWLLAGLLLALRAGGQSLGWGFQLQSPLFVGLLAALIFTLALNLTGLFEVGLGMTRLGGLAAGDSYRGSFLMGGLTVLVATPCTAPFMGAALGFALSQPVAVGLAVFTSLGVGLAAPYVMLAASPTLIGRLPRPGAWMETLKQALSFPMFATVVWLVWVFGNQAGVDSSAVLLLGLTLLGLAGWMYGRLGASGGSARASVAAVMVGLSALGAVVQGARMADPTPVAETRAGDGSDWESFSPARLAALRSEGRPILLDFTADWCLSCKVNDRIALRTEAVRDAFRDANVALLVADWTNRDPVIAETIASYGRSGIPLYVMYPADPEGDYEILPAVLTPGIVIDAVARATGGRASE